MTDTADQELEPPPPAADDSVDRWSQFRRATRWVARIGFLLLLALFVLWQGTTSWTAIAACVGATLALWILSIPCVPHKRSTPTSFWVWFALGAWTTLHLLPLPIGLVRWLSPTAAELHERMAAAAGLPIAGSLPLALAPGDAALQAVVYLLVAVHAYLFSNLLLGAGGRRMLAYFTTTITALGLLAGSAHLAAVHAGAELLPPTLVELAGKAAFINPNHAAGLLNLCLAVTIGRAVHGGGAGRTVSGALALVLVLFVIGTASRGGILTMCVVLLATLASTPTPPSYMRVDPRVNRAKLRFRAGLLVICAMVAATAVGWPIIESEFLTNATTEEDGKIKVLMAAAGQSTRTPMVGWAPGAIATLLAQGGMGHVRVDFAENFLLDRLAADGWIGFLGYLALLVWALRRLMRRTLRTYEAMPYVVAVGVVFVANLVDFSLEIVGVALPTAATWIAAELHFRRTLKEQEALLQWRRRFHGRMMGLTGVAMAAACWLIAGPANGHLSRDVSAKSVASVKLDRDLPDLVRYHAADAHAAYLLGRKAVESNQYPLAARLLDRSVALRPTSAQPRLFRFAVRLDQNDLPGASKDLLWLLEQRSVHRSQALEVALRSSRAEALLVEMLPTIPDKAYEIAEFFHKTRPDLIEVVALQLRKRYPNRRFAIDALRATLYIDRGRPDLAREISAGLLAHKDTEVEGYFIEARLMVVAGKGYEAFHLYRTVCDRRPGHAACASAAFVVLDMNRPDLALPFLRSIHPPIASTLRSWSVWWHWMAIALEQAGKRDEAIDAARRAYSMDPENVDAGLMLGELLIKESLFGEVSELSERLSERFPTNPGVVRLAERVQSAGKPIVFGARRGDLPASATPTRPP